MPRREPGSLGSSVSASVWVRMQVRSNSRTLIETLVERVGWLRAIPGLDEKSLVAR